FYIKNKVNGRSLNVGSDCIKDFTDFDKLGFGLSISQLKNKASKIRRQSEANSHIDGIDRVINDWDVKINSYDFLIPNHIRIPYNKLGDEIRKEYNLFLKSEKVPINELKRLYQSYLDFENEMNKYVAKQKNNPLAVNKAIVDWLE